jgi:site-specific DNA-methyltransferase (adenine-specific)
VTIDVVHSDCIEHMRTMPEGSVDAIVTDPPYHLISGTPSFDWTSLKPSGIKRPSTAPTNDAGRGHRSGGGGFMGQRWDGGAIAFAPETWAAALRVLRPGGFMLAFGAPRTSHRLVCAIEDAGFVIQDSIMWLFGTGYPKSRSALKPAYEPICLAYKPGGPQSLQVEECRIGNIVETWPATRARPISNALYTHKLDGDDRTHTVSAGTSPPGRWPANVCHDGSDEVIAGFPDSEGQSGKVTGKEPSTRSRNIFSLKSADRPASIPRGDSGSAARFFYTAKADAQDRWGSRHPTVKPIDLLRWLVPLITPPGGQVLDPFAGSGTTGVAALATGRNAILIEQDAEYIADIRERLAHYAGEGRHSVASRARRTAPRGTAPLFEGRENDG